MKSRMSMIVALLAALGGFSGVAYAENIVIIGDSLTCGAFGSNLAQGLTQRGNHVTLYCEVSSAPYHWVHSVLAGSQWPCQNWTSENPSYVSCDGTGQIPPLRFILSEHRGERFIIALGTNSLPDGWTDATYATLAKAASENGGSCDWIGPPHVRSDQGGAVFSHSWVAQMEGHLDGFYQQLQNSVSGVCRVVDSRDATAPGKPGNETVDGVHRGETAGRAWSAELLPALTSTNAKGK